MGTCGAKRFFAILAKLRMFLIRRLSLLLVFRMFNLTFHQDKKVSSIL